MIKHLHELVKRAWAWLHELPMDRYERQDPEYIKGRQAYLIEVCQEVRRRRRPEPLDCRDRGWYGAFCQYLTSGLLDQDELWGYEYGSMADAFWKQYQEDYFAIERVFQREFRGEYRNDLPYFVREEAKRVLSRKFSRGPT